MNKMESDHTITTTPSTVMKSSSTSGTTITETRSAPVVDTATHTQPSPSSNDTTDTTATTVGNKYTGRKPKWWKTLAGRRGTKSQRAVIARATGLGYVVPKLDRYRHFMDVSAGSELFAVPPRGVALTADKLLKPWSAVVDNHDHDGGNIANGDTQNNVEEEGTTGTTTLTNTTTASANSTIHTSLEIGFGSGDNLLTNAMHFPHRHFIGAEIHQPGVGTALGRIETAVQDGRYWDRHTPYRQHPTSSTTADDEPIPTTLPPLPSLPYDNIRIYPGDGVKLLKFIPPSSLDSIYLTHPDPWPRPGQERWRVVQEETVREMGRVLKKGGQGCFYLATDAECFDEWTRGVFGEVKGWEEVTPCPERRGWLSVVSKYEEKGMDEGRVTMVQCWRLL